MIYCILFILLLSLSLYTHYKRTDRKYLSLCLFVIFLVVGGLRYEVGSDWGLYVGNFQNYTSGAWTFKDALHQHLYAVIVYLIKLFTSNNSIYIFLIFTAAFSIKFGVMKRYSASLYFSLLFYLVSVFIVFDINGMRQGLALSLVMLSLHFVMQRKLPFYLLCVAIAVLIHGSAIIFLPFYWLAHLTLTMRQRVLYTVVGIALAIPFSWLLLHYGESLVAPISTHYAEKMHVYAHSYRYGTPVYLWGLSSLRKLMVWGVIFYLARDNRNSLNNALLNAYSLSLIVFFLFSFSTEVASRMSFYYACFEIILIPNILFSERFRSSIVVTIITSAIVLLYFFLLCKIVFNPIGSLDVYNNVLLNLFR